MSQLNALSIDMSKQAAAQDDQRRLAAIEAQIAGFERNLAHPDDNTCDFALEETIAYLRAEGIALSTRIRFDLQLPH